MELREMLYMGSARYSRLWSNVDCGLPLRRKFPSIPHMTQAQE
jgi:hypothetical protein